MGEIDQDQPTDEDIALCVQKGDREAFGMLIERYETKILRYARKFLSHYEDREDTVQEVFIKAYTNIQSFQTSQKFSSWLYRIAHNTFINFIKKKGREHIHFFDSDIVFQLSLSDDSFREGLQNDSDFSLIEKYIDTLDPKYREPIVLFYFEEKNYKEIADILHIPLSTVGVRLKRARLMLKNRYEKGNH